MSPRRPITTDVGVTPGGGTTSLAGVTGFSVREVKVFDKARRRYRVYQRSSYTVDFTLKVEVVITVPANEVARILRVLDDVMRTGPGQGGSIFVSDVVKAAAVTVRSLGADASEH